MKTSSSEASEKILREGWQIGMAEGEVRVLFELWSAERGNLKRFYCAHNSNSVKDSDEDFGEHSKALGRRKSLSRPLVSCPSSLLKLLQRCLTFSNSSKCFSRAVSHLQLSNYCDTWNDCKIRSWKLSTIKFSKVQKVFWENLNSNVENFTIEILKSPVKWKFIRIFREVSIVSNHLTHERTLRDSDKNPKTNFSIVKASDVKGKRYNLNEKKKSENSSRWWEGEKAMGRRERMWFKP